MATARSAPARIAIIEQTPSGPLCRATVVMSDTEAVARCTARITASTVNQVTTKMLPPVAA